MQSLQSATTPWIVTFQKGTEKTSARTRNRNKKWQTICRLKFSRKTEKKDRKILYHEMNHSTFPDSNNDFGCGTINITYKNYIPT